MEMVLEKTDPKTIFEEVIPKIWSDYEPRKSQIQMSEAIWEAILTESNAAIEAGTGVGKSLAYLIPSILYAFQNNKPVVVATETKALQEQLLNKDIPLLEKIFQVSIPAELAMGANNYICKRKYEQLIKNEELPDDLKLQQTSFEAWLDSTPTGIRYDYKSPLSEKTWNRIGRDIETCLGKFCKNYDESFYFLARERWKNSKILITNHALLAYHILSNFNILPDFDILIIDEAHNFPEISRSSMKRSFSNSQVLNILNQIYFGKNSLYSKLLEILNRKSLEDIPKICDQVRVQDLPQFSNFLLQELDLQFTNKKRITKILKLDGGNLESNLTSLSQALNECKSQFPKDLDDSESKELAITLEAQSLYLEGCIGFLKELRTRKNNHLVFWCETPQTQNKDDYYLLYSEPVDAKDLIRDQIGAKYKSVIYTSATLTTGPNQFRYFESQIGYEPDIKLQLESPFPYDKNCLLFIPSDVVDPVSKEDLYHKQISEYILKIAKLTNGDCLVLFTSIKSLNETHKLLQPLAENPILSQVEYGAPLALKKYIQTDHSILLGLHSFWQGVDIKGDKLRNVIIAKLPFQVPTDPVFETKTELLQAENKNPFVELQLPIACILLKQGFGRLIRSSDDYGIVSILDTRILTKSYGKDLIKALPQGIKILQNFRDLVLHYENLPK